MDRVFATAPPGKAYVFRHNFSGNKWENVTNKKDGTSSVSFRKRGSDTYFIRIVPEGGEKEEYQLSRNAQIRDSGDGFIQVPLPEKKQLIGIKFKQKEEGPIFLTKIKAEMDINTGTTMGAVVIEDRPLTMAPGSDQLPKPLIPYGTLQTPPTQPPIVSRKPAPPPEMAAPSVPYVNLPHLALDSQSQSRKPPPPVSQAAPPPVSYANLPQPTLNQPQYAVGHYPGQPAGNVRQPANNMGQPVNRYLEEPDASHSPNMGQPVSRYHDQPPVNQYREVRPNPVLVEQPVHAHPTTQTGLNVVQQPGGQQTAQPGLNVVQQPGGQQTAQPGLNVVQQPGGQQTAQTGLNVVQQPGVQQTAHPGMNIPVVQQVRASREMVAGAVGAVVGVAPGMAGMQPRAQAAPPPLPPRTDLARPEPEVPSFTEDEAKSDHAGFLANALNTGSFEAAHRMINMLQKMTQDKPGRKLTISYVDGPDTAAEDASVTLNLEIEFQNQNKNKLSLYLPFKASMTIAHIQQELELTHHIPKATQNWIIGDQLVKGDQLTKSLRDFKIDGEGTTGKVYVYVMHTKKAQVPKEEYEAIRQCQLEERERKKRGMKPHWEMPPPAAGPPGMAPAPTPRPLPNTGMAAAQDYSHAPPPPRRQAWAEDDTYSHLNHNYPVPTPAVVPPQRRQMDPDPTYGRIGSYHPQQPTGHPPPAASQPHFGGGAPVNHMPAVHHPPPQSRMVHDGHQPPSQYPPSQYPPPQQHRPPQPVPPQQHWPPQPLPTQQPQPPQHLPSQQPRPPPQSQPLPPPKARQVGWSCPQCTFINKPRRPGCEICTADRPEDYKIPEDLPPDADEVRIMEGLEEGDRMYQEYAEEEKRRRERERVENFQALMQAEEEPLVTNDEQFDCPICMTEVEPGEGVRLRGCLHQFCKECLNQSIMASPNAEVSCPFNDHDYQCNVPVPEREIKQLVTPEQLQQLYRRALREAESAARNSYHCKTTNCEGFCFYEDEVNEFHCPICTKVNCLTCKAIHEGVNCQEYQEDLRRRAANDEAAKATQDMLEQMVKDGDAMHCPSCQIVVQKKDGCDWIRCSVCKTEICWATKQARWGPKGKGDKSGGCHCRENGKKCHPLCRNCH